MGIASEMIIGGGAATATPAQAVRYLLDTPSCLLTEAEAAEIVWAFQHWGMVVGIRWDRAFAMSCHETRRYLFGNQVALVQRNPAGIGATNDGAPGLTFPSWVRGIGAMFIHLLAWCDRLDLAGRIDPAPQSLDPRIPIVAQVRAEKGKATTWASLGGRWAVPGDGYGAAIERHHAAIMAIAQEQPSMALSTREAIIPATNTNRPGRKMTGGKPQFITIHETANTNAGANAEMHRKFLVNGGGTEGVSFHWCVDGQEAVHLVPDDEIAWHAGDGANGPGNTTSIAIETCVNSDGDFPKTLRNLAQLVALLMARHRIPLANVVQHNRWSGKDCPRKLRAAGWAGQVAAIAAAYGVLTPPAPTASGVVTPAIDWDGEGEIVASGEYVIVRNAAGEVYQRRRSDGTLGPWVRLTA